MTMSNHQLAAGAAQPCYSRVTVSGSDRNFPRYLAGRVQAALMQHTQAYVQHVEVTFNDDTGLHLLLDPERLRRFRQRLGTRIGKALAAKGYGGQAGLRCEWFSTNGHHGEPNFHLLAFLGLKAFYLLGDERESSQTVLNRQIAAAWAGMQELSAQPRGGFYLSDRAGDSGVAALIEAARNVAECRDTGTSVPSRPQCQLGV